MSLREERSAGVILYRVDGKKHFFLVMQYSVGHWDFAKGKTEGDESDIQTALREVREETGIDDVRIHDDFEATIEYEYMDRAVMVSKSVILFLGEVKTSWIRLSDEHQDYIWGEVDDAVERLTYGAAKNALLKAHQTLQEIDDAGAYDNSCTDADAAVSR